MIAIKHTNWKSTLNYNFNYNFPEIFHKFSQFKKNQFLFNFLHIFCELNFSKGQTVSFFKDDK